MTFATTYHVGHFNLGILIGDWGSSAVAEFEDAIDAVNSLAERSPGFVRNIGGETLDAQVAASEHPLMRNPRLAATLSVWEHPKALDHFVNNTLHGAFLRRRANWFETTDEPNYVMWPIKAGHVPTLEEALERLSLLGENGPSSEAFDFAWSRENADRLEEAHDTA